MALYTCKGSVRLLNEGFLTVMIITHFFLALIFHSLLTVVIHWMEGIIWEGIKFLFRIIPFFSALFPFPGGCREKAGAACGCRQRANTWEQKEVLVAGICYLLLFWFGFLRACTSPLQGKDCVQVNGPTGESHTLHSSLV